jgi:hypothetical protein
MAFLERKFVEAKEPAMMARKCLATTRGTKILSWMVKRRYQDIDSWELQKPIWLRCSHLVAMGKTVEIEDNGDGYWGNETRD